MGESLNQRWSATLVGALVASGVREVVIAPGSRSTPLALAFAERPDLRTHSIIDERVAGFFALGLATASGAPVAVLCTSGTAGAHLLPAIIEASEGSAQLVALTADRPWELHDFGAAQTVEQRGLFGRFVRTAIDLPAPEESPDVLRHVTARVRRALAQGGCVHVNAPFREPLAGDGPGPIIDLPSTTFTPARAEPDVTALVPFVQRAERGVIVCGPRARDDGFGAAVHRLGEHLGFPVLAEAASNARYGFPQSVGAYDTLWRSERFAAAMQPDLLLRFGGGLTPKTMIGLGAPVVLHVSDVGHVFDPAHAAQHVVMGDAVRACEALRAAVPLRAPSAWRAQWLGAERAVRARLATATGWSEPLVARDLVASLPAGTNLVLSSSMPIRDVDAFGLEAGGRLHVFSNRGVNGIDGVMSTALGVAAATGRPTTLLIGDVALLHDLGAWVAARTLALPLTVVAVNNDGGGIFHFLPVAERTPHFERLFGTPHGVDLSHVAGLAGAAYTRVESGVALQQAVRAAKGLSLIEAVTSRTDNVAQHRTLFAQLAEVIP